MVYPKGINTIVTIVTTTNMADLNIRNCDPEIIGIVNFYRTKHGLPNQGEAIKELIRKGFNPDKECSWMKEKEYTIEELKSRPKKDRITLAKHIWSIV